MEIPRSFKVGETHYRVKLVPAIVGGHNLRGLIYYALGSIQVSQVRYNGTPRTPKLQAEAFWHETTHAILHDMKHPLKWNEDFVDAFSKRLNQVVHSAKF